MADANGSVNFPGPEFRRIRRIYIEGDVGTGTGTFNWMAAGNTNNVELSWPTLESDYWTGPGYMVAVSGCSAGQVLALAGGMNAGLTPNRKLSQNVKPQVQVHDPMALYYTNLVLSHADKIGLKFIYSHAEYLGLVETRSLERLGDMDTIKALGYSIKDGKRGFWSDFLKPVLSVAAPIVGGMFGPGGAMIGNMVSGLLNGGGRQPMQQQQNYQQQPVSYYQPRGATRMALGYGATDPPPFWAMTKDDQLMRLAHILRGHHMEIRKLSVLLSIDSKSRRVVQDKVPVVYKAIDEFVGEGKLVGVEIIGAKFISLPTVQECLEDRILAVLSDTPRTSEQIATVLGQKESVVDVILSGLERAGLASHHVTTSATSWTRGEMMPNSNN